MKNRILVKFTIVAMMLGLFSPSIIVQKQNNQIEVKISILSQAEAKRGGRGKKGGNRSTNKNRNSNRNVNKNKNTNRNTNVNRNVNKNVNVNVNNNSRHNSRHRHHGSHGYYRGSPILAFTTGMVIGSVIAASTMPTSCTTVIVNGASYRKCSNSYYQPFYQGDTLVYKSVSSPY